MKFKLFVILAILGVAAYFGRNVLMGIEGYGPKTFVEATIQKTYVDHNKEQTFYMVSTDNGTFEVDNGWALGMYNADAVYGSLLTGRKYRLTVKGREWVGFFVGQHYRYILKAELLGPAVTSATDEFMPMITLMQKLVVGTLNPQETHDAQVLAVANPADNPTAREMRNLLRSMLTAHSR